MIKKPTGRQENKINEKQKTENEINERLSLQHKINIIVVIYK